jgi:C-terminal processing protease CtpA/Prc
MRIISHETNSLVRVSKKKSRFFFWSLSRVAPSLYLRTCCCCGFIPCIQIPTKQPFGARASIARAFGAKSTVILVDQHTTGAGERIAAFAQENRLAPIVGTRTAGRLICSSWFGAGHDYFVRLPARLWFTWSDRMLEGQGVTPDIPVDLHPHELVSGRDTQLERAVETVRAL